MKGFLKIIFLRVLTFSEFRVSSISTLKGRLAALSKLVQLRKP